MMSDQKRSRRVKGRDADRRIARKAKRQMRELAPVPSWTPAAEPIGVAS